MIRSKPSCSDSVMLYEANTLTLPRILIAVHIDGCFGTDGKFTEDNEFVCKIV